MFVNMLNWLQGLIKPEPAEEVLGQRGENVAAKYLRTQGFKILVRNFRCTTGEVDIVAHDDPAPEEQVNNPKRHQVTKAAKFYMSRYGSPQPPARFDVVAIVWPTGREPQIRHTADAFEATF
jgi:putative endonuclease